MRLPNATHEAHPWVIAQIAPDFKLEDVWRLPAQGGLGDFPTLLDIVASLDPVNSDSRATRALFALRFRIGALFGWEDAPASEPAAKVSPETSLSARVPTGLRDTVTAPIGVGSTTFVPLYRTDEEWAAEISNSTVHAVMQLAWVRDREGVYHGQMGVYVKPRGRFGAAYMAVIAPFRHFVVYPALMRQIGHAWEARAQ